MNESWVWPAPDLISGAARSRLIKPHSASAAGVPAHGGAQEAARAPATCSAPGKGGGAAYPTGNFERELRVLYLLTPTPQILPYLEKTCSAQAAEHSRLLASEQSSTCVVPRAVERKRRNRHQLLAQFPPGRQMDELLARRLYDARTVFDGIPHSQERRERFVSRVLAGVSPGRIELKALALDAAAIEVLAKVRQACARRQTCG
eukprot:6180124-Pleurochrysis_carterae.AAC.3